VVFLLVLLLDVTIAQSGPQRPRRTIVPAKPQHGDIVIGGTRGDGPTTLRAAARRGCRDAERPLPSAPSQQNEKAVAASHVSPPGNPGAHPRPPARTRRAADRQDVQAG